MFVDVGHVKDVEGEQILEVIDNHQIISYVNMNNIAAELKFLEEWFDNPKLECDNMSSNQQIWRNKSIENDKS